MNSPFKNRAERAAAFDNIDIYPVISSEFTNGRPVLQVLEEIAAGGAKIVQLREKNCSRREIYELALKYRAITAAHDMLLIINDHVDIALAADADGVHLGQEDFPVEAARRIAPELLLGNSTHNLEEALAAQEADVDYINIGPIYPTDTKAVNCGALGLETLVTVSAAVDIPFTVMGGIKEHHIAGLLAAGAGKIAMVTQITRAEDITGQVKKLRSRFNQ